MFPRFVGVRQNNNFQSILPKQLILSVDAFFTYQEEHTDHDAKGGLTKMTDDEITAMKSTDDAQQQEEKDDPVMALQQEIYAGGAKRRGRPKKKKGKGRRKGKEY